jgi:hypothetical protein
MSDEHDPWDLAACILSVANRNGPQAEIEGFTEDLEMAIFGQVTGTLSTPVENAVALWKEGSHESAKMILTYICEVMGKVA